jgi:hypothetical protein
MNDKEMLELAAKAAGVHAGFINEYGGGKTFCWNPLNDDGDAARLAIDLQLSILWFTTLQFVMVERRGVGENIGWTDEAGRGGALRRAITVVAAKIGTTLP